jgi:hypothetical protein
VHGMLAGKAGELGPSRSKKKKIGVPSTKRDTDRTHRAGIVIVGRGTGERIDRAAQNLASEIQDDRASERRPRICAWRAKRSKAEQSPKQEEK